MVGMMDGSKFNSNLLKLKKMSGLDLHIMVSAAFLGEKDLQFIAKVIEKAKCLYLDTSRAKGIVYDNLLYDYDLERFRYFSKCFMRKKATYQFKEEKKSLICAGLLVEGKIDHFFLHETEKHQSLIMTAANIITKHSINSQLYILAYNYRAIQGALDLNFLIYTITSRLYSLLDKVNLDELKLILDYLKESDNFFPFDILKDDLLKEINGKNMWVLRKIVKFAREKGLPCCVHPENELITKFKLLDKKLHANLSRFNDSALNKFIKHGLDIISRLKEHNFQKIIRELFYARNLTTEMKIIRIHMARNVFLKYFDEIIPKFEDENCTMNRSQKADVVMVLEMMYQIDKKETIRVTSEICNYLLSKNDKRLIEVFLDFINSKKDENVTADTVGALIGYGDEIIEKLISKIPEELLYLMESFVYLLKVFFSSNFETFESVLESNLIFTTAKFRKVFSRFFFILIRSMMNKPMEEETYDLLLCYAKKKKLFGVDQILMMDYYKSNLQRGEFFSLVLNSIDYVAVINPEKVNLMNYSVVTEIISYLIEISKSYTSDTLTDLFGGIAARLSVSGLYLKAIELFEILSNQPGVSKDDSSELVVEVVQRAIKGALDGSQWDTLEYLIDFYFANNHNTMFLTKELGSAILNDPIHHKELVEMCMQKSIALNAKTISFLTYYSPNKIKNFDLLMLSGCCYNSFEKVKFMLD